MRISVFGLGYVGAVSAGCLTAAGHDVVGVDPAQNKVDLVNQGKSPVVEARLGELISAGVKAGRLRATQNAAEAVRTTDISLICVGTPSKTNGDLDLSHVKDVSHEIGTVIGSKAERHIFILRSTVLPGTLRQVVIPILEQTSGKRAGDEFGVGNNPEFLREGSAVEDFFNPAKTVFGASDKETAATIADLYRNLPGAIISTSIEVGEMVKYIDNVWHALKVTYANEVGSMCKAIGIDSHAVMDIFCQDDKLNISRYYLKPGFAFGGSCLPKDVRAFTYRARTLDVDLPMMNSILPSNERQLSRGYDLVAAQGNRKVSFLGLAFKAGTDDLRESPVVALVERLIGKGYDVRIFDENVNLSKLVGANREFLMNAIPHVSSLLMENLDDTLLHGETVVVATNEPEFMQIRSRLRSDQHLVDLVRIKLGDDLNSRYHGIAW